jgi:hypothetical protein
MKKYLVICLLLPTILCAQKQRDSIKFEMIKATVDFYASDSVTFPESSKKNAKCKNVDYDCLYKFCKANKLTNVKANIIHWQLTNFSTKKEAQEFKDTLVTELTSLRTHRANLPGYKAYTQKLDTLIGLLKEEVPPSLPTKGDSSKKDSLLPPPPPISNPKPTPTDWLRWAALIAGLGGLGLGLLGFMKKPKNDHLQTKVAAADATQQLEKKLTILSEQLTQKAGTSSIQTFDTRLATVESWIKKASQQPTAANTATEATKSNKAAAPASIATKLYAKLPDMEGGNGFSNNILKTEQLGVQAYEITIGDTNGSYTISSDKDAQSYAVNDFNYILARGCTMNNQPFSNCRVETLQPGTLSKGKDGWMIERKAMVEFR